MRCTKCKTGTLTLKPIREFHVSHMYQCIRCRAVFDSPMIKYVLSRNPSNMDTILDLESALSVMEEVLREVRKTAV